MISTQNSSISALSCSTVCIDDQTEVPDPSTLGLTVLVGEQSHGYHCTNDASQDVMKHKAQTQD